MTSDTEEIKVRPARLEDAAALAPNLRQADLMEISTGSNLSPLEVLESGIKLSAHAFAVERAGVVILLFGVAPTPEPKLGSVWLLGSDQMKSIRLTFLRQSKAWLRFLLTKYPLLGNVVDARNTLHIEWLRWLGFRFLRSAPLGRNGEPFLEFVKLREL